jgi:uncharacterized phage protein gp47/JayE
MPIQQPTSGTTYQNQILNALAASGITQLSPGGKARAFADIVGSVLGTVEVDTFNMVSQSLLPYATGTSLDLIGDIFGVSRLPQTNSTVISDDNNFEFYVRSGTFGSINNGNDIVIPSGVIISSSAPNGPAFVLTAPVTLSAGASSAFFDAVSLTPGSAGNVASAVIDQSNFTNYAQSQFGTLLVTNNFGVVGGQDQESDNDLRYRINLKITSRAGANQAALQFAILQIPGVQNIVFEPKAGTFIAYVYGISPQVPPSLLLLVQTAINNTAAFPLTGLAVAPNLVGFSLETTVTFVPGISSADQQAILQSAISAAQNYINNLAIGAPLIINQLAAKIIDADQRILDIGAPDNPIESIFIWRSRANGTRYSRFLVQDYTPALGERIVTEYSIQSPVNLIAA